MGIFNLSAITANTMLELECSMPSDVNAGDCYIWVANVLNKHRGLRVVEAEFVNGSHVFIKRGGLYYDAEHPTGIAHWSEMSYFQRNGKPSSVKMISAGKFRKNWF